MKIDWNMVSAVGQWGGAVATFSAVIVALKQNKPKVKVTASIRNVIASDGTLIAENRLYITAINIGSIPVQITSAGLRMPRRNKYDLYIVPELDKLPKVLMPSEEVSIWTDAGELAKEGLGNFNIACVYDSSGKVHYCSISFIKKIQRFYWWNFSKLKIDKNNFNKSL